MNDSRSSILDPRSSVPPPAPLPLPRVPVVVRPGTPDDVPFMDSLQKLHAKQVGWMPRKQLEAKVAAGQVLVAESDEGAERRSDGGESGDAPFASPCVAPSLRPSVAPSPVGYCIAADRYMKREDVGIVYQMNVAPGRQRGLVGATLLKAVFDRAAYGCRLFCCWCAQDIEANRFWEAMGFVPLAFRAGGRGRNSDGGSKRRSDAGCGGAASSPFVAPSLRRSAPSPRIHIFWQRRIRAGDVTTPWWFPSQTSAGSIREDRLVLPIPPGTHWGDAKPLILPGSGEPDALGDATGQKALPGPRARKPAKAGVAPVPAKPAPLSGGLFFAPPPPPPPEPAAAVDEKPPREKKPKAKNDPRLVAAARELRDRWLERVNGDGLALPETGKYDVSRSLEGAATTDRPFGPIVFSEGVGRAAPALPAPAAA